MKRPNYNKFHGRQIVLAFVVVLCCIPSIAISVRAPQGRIPQKKETAEPLQLATEITGAENRSLFHSLSAGGLSSRMREAAVNSERQLRLSAKVPNLLRSAFGALVVRDLLGGQYASCTATVAGLPKVW